MKILARRKFHKAFKKIPGKLQEKFYEQLAILQKNITDKRLNNHALTGKYLGYRSFNVAGDWRVIFEETDNETIELVNIGTHSQLYG